MFKKVVLSVLLASSSCSFACDDCTGQQDVIQTRNVRPRSQPGVPQALNGPSGPLSWGQINFLHTTDTHGWLEGHLKQQNYGADWGDFVSFSKYMKVSIVILVLHLRTDAALVGRQRSRCRSSIDRYWYVVHESGHSKC